MPDFFAPDALIRRIAAEPAPLVGAGRALLLQIAHPAVAQGVADHSDFQHNPFKRLRATLEAVYAIVYGSEELAEAVGAHVRHVHDFVSGPTYRANDPDNLLWVHATLVDTLLTCYQRIVRPLTPVERAELYDAMARVAVVFGCPRHHQPADVDAFDAYFREHVETMDVTDVTRRLANDIIRPTLPLNLHVPLAPALSLHRRAAVGLLPARLRDEIGFTWTADDDRSLDRWLRIATTVSRAPRPLRTAPVGLGRRYLVGRAGRVKSGGLTV